MFLKFYKKDLELKFDQYKIIWYERMTKFIGNTR